ncbi:phage holin family protein [Saccharopolyspora rhizosphaerae]|uniref:Phage holin family protein n=1 Tax=Saccharopolyspora rhizosphaerae TaxID=2492662 RepID=A0A3R8QLF3_9PSEU|nr:phage holin family protein [Saccharopolyspora rhizosphaerae]RRO15057.1 phage holin family protein [Saccharopolyspora rhizosphaerae]
MVAVNSAQKSTNASRDGAEWSAVNSIPLSEEGTSPDGQSIGALVKDATTHLSTLVRSEVELAKSEIAGEVKKAVRGSVYFILALCVLVFSLFFLFFTAAEALDAVGLWRWAAFGIVFLAMLLVAGLFALLGFLKVRKLHAPKRTVETLKETKNITKRRHTEEATTG